MASSLWLSFLPYLTSPVSWVIGLLGLFIGSFLNVCIYRIPQGSFWHSQRSHCPHCGALIPAWLNLPLLSFFMLRGKARCCQAVISWQYPVVEALTGLLFIVVYGKFPFLIWQQGIAAIDHQELVRFIHASVFASLMIVCSVIDIRLRIIPDKISLPMILLTPLVVCFHPELTWQSGLWGVVVGGLTVYAIAWIYVLVRRREGIGMGDVKLLAAIGGWLGYQAIFPSLFYGSILGSLYGATAMLISRKISLQTEIPFGPFLAIGAMIHLLLSMHIQEILLF